ncbi:MAG: hypothetical protein JNL66_21105 [Alphaproteobacteria bacterium]|nr:hypothetical protein [Alphaproteobacteria bacterium]
MRVPAVLLLAALSGCIGVPDAAPAQRPGIANPPGFRPPPPPAGGPAPMAAIPLLQPIWPMTSVEFGERCPLTRARLPPVDRPPMSLSAAREVLVECDIERARAAIETRHRIAREAAQACQARNQSRRPDERESCPIPP